VTDYLDEIQARADAATERAIREAAEPAIQAWADAVETGAVDSAEVVEALAVAGVTWRIAAHARTDVPRLVAFAKAVLALSHDPACHDDVECDCNVGNIRWLADQHLGGDR
jgi:uncharacterized protein (UPF0147 family)